MAELGVIMSMITITSTAANILGVIKRRCGASQAIIAHTNKCTELVSKTKQLLETLQGEAQVPNDTREIITPLNQRYDEFEEVVKNLKKMKRRVNRPSPIDRTEKFIMGQGWAKEMEAIHNDLAELRAGVEHVVSNWGAARFVVKKLDEIATIDVARNSNSGVRCRCCERDKKAEILERDSVNYMNTDRILMAMVKLTPANKAALDRYASLGKYSVPQALFVAGLNIQGTDMSCAIELLEHSAKLHYPHANHMMGVLYKQGIGVEKDLELALTHFKVACSSAHTPSFIELMEHFQGENDLENVLKYFEMGTGIAENLFEWFQLAQFALAHGLESTQSAQAFSGENQEGCELEKSICYFFGLGVPKSCEHALNALEKFDSAAMSMEFQVDIPDGPHVMSDMPIFPFSYSNDSFMDNIRGYLDFLFAAKQFFPFLCISLNNKFYSSREWKGCVLRAAKENCAEAHIFLAHSYLSYTNRNESKMKRHLRIAADAGHADAQSLCRQLFAERASVSRGVKQLEDERNHDQENERLGARVKRSKRKKRTSRKKRIGQASS